MATTPRSRADRAIDYPTSDGKPMAETDTHRKLMTDLIATLEDYYEDDPTACVSGNLLLYYEEGNRRKHVSPDVFVSLGVGKRLRDYYLMWEEGKGPDVVFELTSPSTRSEDVNQKMALYRDVLGVTEYFMFDPREEYLRPSMQGYRLAGGAYEPIAAEEGRLRSEVLGLLLERDGQALRLVDPETGLRLPTPAERMRQADQDAARAEEERARAEERAEAEHALAQKMAEENERLRREIEALRRGG